MSRLKTCCHFIGLCALGFAANAEMHVHGQGQLLLAQDGEKWQLEFILPAADVLGFEHEPETPEQVRQLKTVAQRFTQIESIIHLNGDCKLEHGDYELPYQDHHEKGEHDESHSNEAREHNDIEVTYLFDCGSPVTEVRIQVFNWATSLERINAKWFHDKGQGMAQVTPQQPLLAW
ncbi:ZrgA family zinc uptake protein [Alteromonas sp. a30]|uniref:ZrgA family zinc uptake protein n=1 Tax=Alteromonas sp. a30 TaxID=2730917 RepID=UPI00227EA09F|nr:DUF2796 domain-containing protein [Alteromonas sp. a30]MCY7293822.1 DUF2796 domain-containing protein [Alteromonas sp. a30]